TGDQRSAQTPDAGAMSRWRTEPARAAEPAAALRSIFSARDWAAVSPASQPLREPAPAWRGVEAESVGDLPAGRAEASTPLPEEAESYPLGVARGQVALTYIVAEAADGLVIVDQHAAHERLVLERLRAAREAADHAASQALLMPEVVELDELDCDRLEEQQERFAEVGLAIERFGPGAMLVRALPAMLAGAEPAALLRDLADDLSHHGEGLLLGE